MTREKLCRLNSIQELQDSMAMYLSNSIKNNADLNTISIDDIIATVCEILKIPVTAIEKKCREKELVFARHWIMYFGKKLTSCSLKSIGKRLGGRDHTTIIHGLNVVSDYLTSAPFRYERQTFAVLCEKFGLDPARELQDIDGIIDYHPIENEVLQLPQKKVTEERPKKKYFRLEPIFPDPVKRINRPAADHTNTHWEKKYAEA